MKLPTQSAMEVSLPLKKAEAGVASLSLWGRLSALDGRDYYVGQSRAHVYLGKVVEETRHFYSQDGVNWMDLGDVAPETEARCLRVAQPLSGDAATMYTVEEPAPEPEKPEPAEGEGADGEGEEGEEGEGDGEAEDAPAPEPLRFEVSELQRLKAIINAVGSSTRIAPKGAHVLSAKSEILPNATFSGVAFPEQLDSFLHVDEGPAGTPLGEDQKGTWALQYDALQQRTVIKSLLYPGYAFYYSGASKTWGGLYSGTGAKNTDLLFML